MSKAVDLISRQLLTSQVGGLPHPRPHSTKKAVERGVKDIVCSRSLLGERGLGGEVNRIYCPGGRA